MEASRCPGPGQMLWVLGCELVQGSHPYCQHRQEVGAVLSPATAWICGAPLWVPSGGQRSSPLSTAPASVGSTTIEGSR